MLAPTFPMSRLVCSAIAMTVTASPEAVLGGSVIRMLSSPFSTDAIVGREGAGLRALDVTWMVDMYYEM